MRSEMSMNRMFVILASITSSEHVCFKTAADEEAQLWHCRYGHLSYKGLKTMHDKKMVKGLPLLTVPTKLCEGCMIGKQHRDPFPKQSEWRAAKKLQLVHSDICGPITPVSLSNKRYLITFIDDHTRKIWVQFIAEKSEALMAFKRFKVLTEKEVGESICCLRTDRGGEFNSQEFKQFCEDHGISRQLTAAYTPQQNGVAERKNRAIMNMARSMLVEREVPREFWPEAVNWTVFLLNRSPTLALKDKTPEEAWKNITPSVEFFKVFGCIGYVHNADQQRRKLDDKSTKCVHLGLSKESKAYRMYNPVTKKIVISRDVVFDENESWKWGRSETEPRSSTLEWGEDEIEETSDGDGAENGAAAGAATGAASDSDHAAEIGEENGENGSFSDEVEVEQNATNLQSGDAGAYGRRQGRVSREPAWMRDHVSGEGLSENEEDQDMIMYTEAGDPRIYEEAATNSIWKKAMANEIELKYCSSQEQVADIMTKPLKLDTSTKLREQLGVCDMSKIVNCSV